MLTLDPALLAAQKAPLQQPYIGDLTISSDRWGVEPMTLTQLYSEPAAGHPFAACIAPDGSIVRARNANGDLYVQQVTTPASAPASAWSTWTLLGSGLAEPGTTPALAAYLTNRVQLVYIKPGAQTIVRRLNSSNGATASWDVEATVDTDTTAGSKVQYVAVGGNTSGSRLILWFWGPNTSGADDVYLRYITISSTGALSARATAPLPAVDIPTGLAIYYTGDWSVHATARFAAGSTQLLAATYGDGLSLPAGSWDSTWSVVASADDAANYQLSLPSVGAVCGRYRALWWARRPGSGDRMYTAFRPSTGWSPVGWSAGRPLGNNPPQAGGGEQTVLASPLSSGGNQSAASLGSSSYLLGERSAWSLPSAVTSLNLASRLISYTYRQPGISTFLLDDRDGGLSGSQLEPLPLPRPGARLRLSRGLRTSPATSAVYLPDLEVVAVERVRIINQGSGEHPRSDQLVVVRARSVHGLLKEWRAERTRYYAAGTKTVKSILADLLTLAGTTLADDGSSLPSADGNRQPSVTLDAGSSASSAVRGLLRLIRDRLRPSGAGFLLTNPVAGSVYTYGAGSPLLSGAKDLGGSGGSHPLFSWRLTSREVTPNHVQVYGRVGAAMAYGEALDAASIPREGHRVRKVYDASLSSGADAATRASAALIEAQRRAVGGEIVARPNLGLELWDRVTVAVGPSTYSRTVTSYTEEWAPDRGVWQQTVRFGEE